MTHRPFYTYLCFVFIFLHHTSAGSQIEDDIIAIRRVLEYQSEKILRLEKENEFLKTEVSDLKTTVSKLHDILGEEENPEEIVDSTIRVQTRKRRLLIGQPTTTPVPVEPIAFYAYMSKPEPTPSNHHTLIFDVIKTNLGNGYSKYSGTFIAPAAGTYVITWTINTSPGGAHYLNLLVNGNIAGGTLTDTQDTNDYDSDSSTVVLVLNKGDNVNIRTTAATERHASIYVDSHAVTSFAGWRIGNQ